MAGILGNKLDLINHMLVQSFTLEPRLAGLVQQGPGEAELWVFFVSKGKRKL